MQHDQTLRLQYSKIQSDRELKMAADTKNSKLLKSPFSPERLIIYG